MYLHIDIIRQVIIWTDHETTLKLLQLYPKLFLDQNIWKTKITHQFTGQQYFDFWMGEENYLIHDRDTFALAINFGDSEEVSGYLLEYDKILKYVLSLVDDSINYAGGYDNVKLLKFSVKKQFILAHRNEQYNYYIIGQYNDREEVVDIIKSHQKVLTNGYYTDDEQFTYVIINLAYMTPLFIKLGKLSGTATDNSWYEFFRARPFNLIDFAI